MVVKMLYILIISYVNLHYVTVDVGNGKVLSSHQLSMMEMIRDGAVMTAMSPTMMMIPGMGMMMGSVMMMGPVMMNEPESYGNSFLYEILDLCRWSMRAARY
jgi:hypothetical protein